MIAIINQGEKKNGKTLYSVQINHDVICQFYHRREDGLAACLRKAAEAVDSQKNTDLLEMIKSVKGER